MRDMSKPTSTAEILLSNAVVAARVASSGLGTASAVVPGYGTAVVCYDRTTRTYDVGTMAKSHAKGRRGQVLSALTDLLARAA